MIDVLRSGFADPPVTAAPMMRWWWFRPSVDRDELSRELTAMAGAGFGVVEVAYVYPLGPAATDFMSDAFLADLRFAADRVHELDLRFDLTLGSGWSFGGPHITDEARRTGQNVKRAAVIVRNTAANALATDQHIIELVAQSEARYGRRFRMQDLDRAMASVRSRFAQRPSHPP